MGFFAKLSHKIGDNLVRSNVIKEEDAEIYIYGINQIMVSVLNVSSTLIIGLILGMLLESVIFLAAYIPLRSFAGGYHAKTPVRCYFTSVFLIFAVLLFCKYIPFNLLFHGGILIISSAICAFLCPVQDNNKPLDTVEHKRYKKIAIVILLIEVCVWVLLVFVVHQYEKIAVMSIFVEAIILLLGKIKNMAIPFNHHSQKPS